MSHARFAPRDGVSPLANRSVLITGGTGSFGSAFARRSLEAGAKRVAIFSRDELKQSQLRNALGDDPRLRFFVGSVTDQSYLVRALSGVDLVAHAAALKQIPSCEANPWAAVATNVLGTQAVAAAAIDCGVERAIFLSTDKAAAPNTLYGATKLLAERGWIQANVYAAGTRTRFAATRYGNVLGSRGSVVPVFQGQALDDGELQVTHPAMTRFWMRLSDAVGLVELALAAARGGEVFVPKLASASILRIAEAVAPDVPIRYTGIRSGEKIHETLITEDESRACYDAGDYYVLEPARTWEHVPDLPLPHVSAGFSYRSDTNPDGLTVGELRDWLCKSDP